MLNIRDNIDWVSRFMSMKTERLARRVGAWEAERRPSGIKF